MTPRITALICEDRGNVTTAQEREFYGSRCEGCEREAWGALQRWKAGAPDATFDRMFAVDEPTVH